MLNAYHNHAKALKVSAILEIKDISAILDPKYLTGDTWVIFDLDDTIMELPQSLGSDQWFEAHIEMLRLRYIEQNNGLERAVVETVELYNNIHERSDAKAV